MQQWHNQFMQTFKHNIIGQYGDEGKKWLDSLTKILCSSTKALHSASIPESHNFYHLSKLLNVSSNNTWQDWLIYFLNGVAVQSEDALSRAERINNLLNKWKLQVASGSSSVPVDIVDHFAVNPYLTIKKIAEELEIAYSTAERGVRKLLSENIIRQVNDGKRDKLYCATEILSILEEPEKIYADVEED